MNTDVLDLQNATALSPNSRPQAKQNPSELGKNEFLKLLMTQMSNQDPLEPMDNQQFIQQLTSFSNLEALQNLGGKLDDLVTMTGANNAANAVSLLGKEVRVAGNTFNGPQSTAYYELPTGAEEVSLEVRSESTKQVVKVIENLPGSEGMHQVDISDLEEGEYFFTVSAKDVNGDELEGIQYSVNEAVTGVNFNSEVPTMLTSSGREIPASELIEIRQSSQAGSSSDDEHS